MNVVFNPTATARLKRLGVGLVYLIGSHARGEATALSDVDFAVAMKEPSKLKKFNSVYQSLYEVLAEGVRQALKNKTLRRPLTIDIVFLDTAPLYYAIAARDHGKILFEISPRFRADFEAKTTIHYADFEPFRREQERATLQMI